MVLQSPVPPSTNLNQRLSQKEAELSGSGHTMEASSPQELNQSVRTPTATSALHEQFTVFTCDRNQNASSVATTRPEATSSRQTTEP